MRPLVTFCQMCFDQREYIGAAIDAAFSQTYTPLEIVINDDHSTDGSWEIIQQKTAAYVGPHKVIIHRNETNFGIAKNCQVMFSLAHGELFVKGDGDDISLPDRVEKLVAAWELHDRRADILASGYAKMDMKGKVYDSVNPPFTGWDLRPFEDWFRCVGFFYLGAAFAVSRRLYDLFPKEVRFGRAGDDNIYTGRAALLSGGGAGGGGYVIPDKLVWHRMGSGVSNSRGRSYRQKMLDVYRLVHEALLQNEEDLRCCSVAVEGGDRVKDCILSEIRGWERLERIWEGRSFRDRVEGFGWQGVQQTLIRLILLLPPQVGDVLLNAMNRLLGLFKGGHSC